MDAIPTIEGYLSQAGLKQAELARKIGISKGHLNDIVQGKQPVSHRIACRLEELSGIPWRRWMAANPEGKAA